MSDIPKTLKEQSRSLQQLINKGEHLQEKLGELEKSAQLYEYHLWLQRVLNTLGPLLSEIRQDAIVEEIKSLPESVESVATIRGKMHGMLQDIEQGKLNYLVYSIQKENIEDLLTQAKQALYSDDEEISSDILAAMLTSTILENAVRNLCEREGILVNDGKWITLGQLIDKLTKVMQFSGS